MTESTLLLVGLCIILLAAIAILVVTVGARREVRNISYELGQRYSRMENELDLEQATKELERLRNEHSENLRLAGLKEQEWAHRDEQQERQRLHLERECQNLMGELERWRVRHTEIQERANWLEQERSKAQQKVLALSL